MIMFVDSAILVERKATINSSPQNVHTCRSKSAQQDKKLWYRMGEDKIR